MVSTVPIAAPPEDDNINGYKEEAIQDFDKEVITSVISEPEKTVSLETIDPIAKLYKSNSCGTQNRFNKYLSPSLEGIADGQKRQELEYTFYGYLENFDSLKDLEKEIHEQYSIPLESDHIAIRIRKTNDKENVLTVKAKREGIKGSEEVESIISDPMFLLLKETAGSGFKKIRYFIPVGDSELKWEVDVFLDLSGQPSHWVKLDLEVTDEFTQVPSLPFKLEKLIVNQGKKKTDEELERVSQLWEVEWNILDKDHSIITDENVIAKS